MNSPEVAADRRVTFRLSAPAAQQVVVAGERDGKHQLREIAPKLFR